MASLIQNKQEKLALDQLRDSVHDLSEKYDDTTLLRFLRARKLNVEKALDMLKANISWRVEWELSSLQVWDPPKEISDGFDLYHCGHDHEGRPVYYAPLGNWTSARDLFSKGLDFECMKFAGKSMDMVHSQLLKTVNQNFVCIVDIEGATYRKALYEIQNLKGIQHLIWLFRDYEANYPETLHKAFIINTPSVFYWGFNIVKPLMTKHTLSKIQIFDVNDDEWSNALHSNLPINAIPEKLGGTGEMIKFY